MTTVTILLRHHFTLTHLMTCLSWKKLKNPIIVDGDDKLVEIGKNNNWECVSFR